MVLGRIGVVVEVEVEGHVDAASVVVDAVWE